MFAPAGIAMGITGGWVNALWLIHARLPPVRSAASPSPPSTDTILVPGVGADAPTTQDPVGSPPEIPGINWPVAGQDPLRPDQPAGLEDPEAGRARAVALEFLAAANRGDVAALRRLAAEDLVQRLEEQLEGQTQEDRAERQVRKLVCENDRARAEVWMKNPEVQNLYAELLATVELEHSAADWRVTRFSVKPYIRDLEEEVRP